VAGGHEVRGEFGFGRKDLLREGEDIALLVTGVLAGEALSAAALLREDGLSARVVGVPTVKPLCGEALAKAVRGTRAVVTLEEHTIIGGFGSAVAEALAWHSPQSPVLRVGMRDEFGQSGHWHELLDYYGLTAPGVAAAAREALSRAGRGEAIIR